MKKTLLILMALMLWICPVWADEIDDALPENASLRVRTNTRQMVQTGISQDDATQMTRAMLQHRFQERHIIQAQNMLMETMQSGLPVEPVMNKAFEGMAKNQPDEGIVQAMKMTQSRYAYAYRKAGELTTDEETQNSLGLSIAQGMGAGLQDKDIEPVMAQLQTRVRQMSQNKADELCLQTFLAARLMARLGVDSDTVSDVVCLALQHRFTAREMQQLGSNFNTQSQQMSSNHLANEFAQKIGQGQKPGQSGSDQGGGGESGNAPENTGGPGSENGSGNDGSVGADGTDGSKGGSSNGASGGNGNK
jgi:CRISPR/Cas system-associated protein endoribonuclease Cas2